MRDKKTYENWLVSLDSDNFSMFIKTWFAFLASARELALTFARDEEKDALLAAHGDKVFLDYYKRNLSSVELTTVMQANILETFSSSRDVVRAEYPDYYFQTYFKKIVPFSFRKKEPVSLVRSQYKFDIVVNEKSIHFGILVESESTARKLQSKYIEKRIPITVLPDVLTFVDNQGDFYAHIKNELQDRLFKQIKLSTKADEAEKLKRNLAALCRLIVNDATSSNLHGHVFQIWCDELKPMEKDIKEWFIGFCYLLRNVLFHRTIDPFDSRWSGIMKSCYQGLREFLLNNIAKLNKVKTK